MSPLLQRLRSPTWQYAILGGLASVPLTLALYLRAPGTTWDVSGIALCALAAGYLAKRRGLESTPVGLRAGAVGAFPVLLSVAELVPVVLSFTQPAWFTAVQLALVTVSVPLLVGTAALVGGVAGRLGGWLAERGGHPQTPVGS
ncbi:DUF5518 domain-containing protein [Haloarcula sediminis]|uniref:DUF5518 domain-containing protein n=1 Tax=Haloarcula sediminis TaxID=3111777 RepID=UPI002D798FE9|nr:DUF5518 domain-containing protein [Haloarcula sp. CK38]